MKKGFLFTGVLIAAVAVFSSFRSMETTPAQTITIIDNRIKELKWYSLEEAQKAGSKDKRKYMIDIYTDWCGWCKVMDKKTFSVASVSAILTEKFYPVKFNAEQTENIIFNEKVYKFNGQTNELINVWLGNEFGYPTTVFLDEKLKVIGKISGYKDATEFKKILTFYDSEAYKKVTLEQYLASTAK